jgi:hypothetical protein
MRMTAAHYPNIATTSTGVTIHTTNIAPPSHRLVTQPTYNNTHRNTHTHTHTHNEETVENAICDSHAPQRRWVL